MNWVSCHIAARWVLMCDGYGTNRMKEDGYVEIAEVASYAFGATYGNLDMVGVDARALASWMESRPNYSKISTDRKARVAMVGVLASSATPVVVACFPKRVAFRWGSTTGSRAAGGSGRSAAPNFG